MFEFFKKIIECFDRQHIPYMLSGSIAMGMYIIPRATKDIDFVIHLQPGDIESFVAHFAGAYYVSKDAIIDAVNRQSIFNIIDHASGFKADFVVLKNSEYRLAEFDRKQIKDFFGLNIYIVSPEDLLISKLIWIQEWQTAVQMEDIKNLAVVPGLQLDYVSNWIKKLNLNTFNLLEL
ncbi:hypothetical protein KXD93_10145 [Mucilaginibacter sp. BJC16-A38]|uniref:DUF6036 family nucleotidyltransferase n=1 Tax=Mucilaginibacter phenanthrenivorans TaxID=1234842 RepID=UPI0021581446|nr:DUF6036 family nucleotidyltransferase [Mucilaginibacter phenanthrenivorans]MCR8558005.1 hypothetical protein [Mucilaginibacter phenanthrenivorans]